MTSWQIPVNTFYGTSNTHVYLSFEDRGWDYHIEACRDVWGVGTASIRRVARTVVPPYMFLGQEAEAL